MAVKEEPQGNDSILYPGFSTDVAATQSVRLDSILSATVELRSSLRRLGCYRRVPSVMSAGLGHSGYESFRVGLDIVNPANITIKLKKGDKIAQMLVMFDGPTEKELLNDNIYFIHDKKEYRKYLDLDHGMEINETKDI
jgi:deoxycytidine triphosphate deaminase